MSFLARMFRRSTVTIEQPDDTRLNEQLHKAVQEHVVANANLRIIAHKQQRDGELARQVISDMLDRASMTSKGQNSGQP
jgi:hypothetical protein